MGETRADKIGEFVLCVVLWCGVVYCSVLFRIVYGLCI